MLRKKKDPFAFYFTDTTKPRTCLVKARNELEDWFDQIERDQESQQLGMLTEDSISHVQGAVGKNFIRPRVRLMRPVYRSGSR